MRSRSIPFLCLAALALALASPPGAARTLRLDEVRRLDEWPELPDAKRVAKDVQRLRKARTEEMGAQATEALIADGAGVVPALLGAFEKERDEDARARVRAVLDAVTGAPHTRLLAQEFDDKSGRVRVWALRRVAAFPDPGVRAEAERALERAAAAKKGKAEPEESYVAALCVTSSGSLAGFAQLLERAVVSWSDVQSEMRTALEAVRGDEATELALAQLAKTDRKVRIAALRMLAGCGAKSSTVKIRPLLDETDNAIRIAAINALRGMVDGDPPLERLPVFEAIERANRWKARI